MSSLPQQPGDATISNTMLPSPTPRGGPNMGGMGGMGNPMAQGHNQMHEQMMMQGGQGNGQQPNFGPMAGIQPAIIDPVNQGGLQQGAMGQQMYGGMDQTATLRSPMDLQSSNYSQPNNLTGGTK